MNTQIVLAVTNIDGDPIAQLVIPEGQEQGYIITTLFGGITPIERIYIDKTGKVV